MNKITFDIVSGDSNLNVMVTSFDIFEHGKVLANIERITMTSEKRRIKKIAEGLLQIYAQCGKTVFFLGFRGRTSNDICFCKRIRTISNGKQFILFRDVLSQLGYSCMTDNNNFVKPTPFNSLNNKGTKQ